MDMPTSIATGNDDRRRFAVTAGLFLAAYALSQADKQIVGLVAEPVKRAFALSDTELGLLQGLGFALAFAVAGFPLARLVDGGHRVRIAAACVAIWSIATLLCGLATSFAMLFAMRVATAAAEAGLAPAFFSLIAQQKAPARIVRATGAYMLGPFVGGGLILIAGGLLLRRAGDTSGTMWGWSDPWRLTFLALGLPGLLVALLLILFAHESPRPAVSRQRPAPIGAVVRAIFVESPLLRDHYLALLLFTAPLYAVISWYPALLVRDFQLAIGQAAPRAGLAYLVAGVAGTLIVSGVAGRRAYSIPRMMTFFAITALALCATMAGIAFAATPAQSLSAYAAYAFGAAMILASMAVPVQLALRHDMIGRGIAILTFATSATSGSFGPLLIGLLSDRTGLPLRLALALPSALSLAGAAWLFHRAAGHARTAD